MTVCPICEKTLDEGEFYLCKTRRPNGLSYRCRKCTSEYSKTHRDKINARRKEYRHKIGVSKSNKPGAPKGFKHLKRRTTSGKISGPKYFSRGKEYVEGWNELRKVIYKRDNWTCQECGVKCHNSTKKKIQCHHIDYNIKNGDHNNLITLCVSCHAKTNFRKTDWTQYFINKHKD